MRYAIWVRYAIEERTLLKTIMNEARIEAYLALIQALLQCENGQEPALLQANAELVDAGLVAVMGQYADFLQQQGEDNNAGWLRNMAQQLGQFLGLFVTLYAKSTYKMPR
ncbi:hypothetical protein PN467_06580 [Microcystis aeruginosa CS-563/04]|uniref:hypothetical protein n=1 Tax=Microcystis aeruginosa TaxID=1126 RepID=UPI00232ED6E6|nr:hypothetical protein [Microcystis aeruginosa]MDB9420194.1 hypothetical protein [Microcystis aeruginosa CS-563/04]